MKIKSLLSVSFLLLVSSGLAFGQGAPGQSNYPNTQQTGSGAPGGTCPGTNVRYLNTSNGNLYTCPVPGGLWVLLAGQGSGVVTTNLLAEYMFNEGTGTTLIDSSGNGNNATFCASAPTWSAANSANAGLTFNGSSNCVNLPAALNSARTFQLVESFTPPNVSTLEAPICGNGSNNWGALFRGYQIPQNAITGGEFFLASWAKNGNPYQQFTTQPAQGTAIVTWELGATADSTQDEIWINNNLYPFAATQPNGSPVSTVSYDLAPFNGNYVLGGSAAGSCVGSVSSWWPGIMYELLVYSSYLTPAQVTQNYAAIIATNNARGIQTLPQNLGGLTPNANNQFVALGDSITAGTATTTVYPQYITFPSSAQPWNWIDLGIPSNTAQATAAAEGINMRIAAAVYPGAGSNYEPYWEGTNDCAVNPSGGQGIFGSVVSALRAYRKHLIDVSRSQPIAIVSMISRTGAGLDTCKNALNELLRQNWRTFADDFIDVAADPNLGADGAYASTTYFVDAVHPTSQAQANNVAPIFQRAVGRYFGNQSWTTATTYTTAAAAAVATTAGSQSSTTVTVTMSATPANCQVGNTATIAGVTPSAYNNFWQILTRSSTQITFYALATSLGTITGQGTIVCPQQQDADVYTILAGSSVSPSFTLESCMGYTGQNLYFKNANTTSPWVLTPFQSTETIDGASSLTMPIATSGNLPTVILQATLISASAAGCTWKRIE